MKWRGYITAAGGLGALLFVFFQFWEDKPDARFAAGDKMSSAATNATKILQEMTLEEKIGQLIIGGFLGTTFSVETKSLIQNYKLSGFNLLARNVKASAQSKKLILDIKEIYRKSGLPQPFI